MAEGDAGKQEAPEQSDGDTEDSRQDAVAPVFGHGESGVAELPHSIQTVCPIRLCNDILKLHLMRNLKEVLLIHIHHLHPAPSTRPLWAHANVEVHLCRETNLYVALYGIKM